MRCKLFSLISFKPIDSLLETRGSLVKARKLTATHFYLLQYLLGSKIHSLLFEKFMGLSFSLLPGFNYFLSKRISLYIFLQTLCPESHWDIQHNLLSRFKIFKQKQIKEFLQANSALCPTLFLPLHQFFPVIHTP